MKVHPVNITKRRNQTFSLRRGSWARGHVCRWAVIILIKECEVEIFLTSNSDMNGQELWLRGTQKNVENLSLVITWVES